MLLKLYSYVWKNTLSALVKKKKKKESFVKTSTLALWDKNAVYNISLFGILLFFFFLLKTGFEYKKLQKHVWHWVLVFKPNSNTQK